MQTKAEWTKSRIRQMLAEEFPGEWGNEPHSGIGNAKVLRSTNLDDYGHANYREGAERDILHEKLTQKHLRPGDILLEASGGGPGKPVGRVAIFNPPDDRVYICSNFFHTLRPTRSIVPRFLLWRLLFAYSEPRIWSFQQQTTGIINLKVSEYLDQVIDWPPLPEQNRITEILDTLDDAIVQTEALIAKLRQINAGLMHDLLTCGLDEYGQLRDPVAYPERFKETVVGRVPREWETSSIGSITIHVGSGATPIGGSEVYKPDGVIFIRSQNVTFEGLLLDDVVYIDPQTHERMKRSEIFAHDVLLNITGASIGRCCPLPEGIGSANVNQHVCAIRLLGPNREDAIFLSSVLASHIGQSQIDRLNAGGNRQGLNYEQLRSFTIPWPERDERARIASALVAHDTRLRAEETYCDKLNQMKQGLMADLLTGRVRVSTD